MRRKTSFFRLKAKSMKPSQMFSLSKEKCEKSRVRVTSSERERREGMFFPSQLTFVEVGSGDGDDPGSMQRM